MGKELAQPVNVTGRSRGIYSDSGLLSLFLDWIFIRVAGTTTILVSDLHSNDAVLRRHSESL